MCFAFCQNFAYKFVLENNFFRRQKKLHIHYCSNCLICGTKYKRMGHVKFVEDTLKIFLKGKSVKTDRITSNFIKPAFRKFCFVHSWILCLIYSSLLGHFSGVNFQREQDGKWGGINIKWCYLYVRVLKGEESEA